jgi:origin recognition complex subunit 4
LSLPQSLPAFWDICKEGLLADAEELESEGFDSGAAGQDESLTIWKVMVEVGPFSKILLSV